MAFPCWIEFGCVSKQYCSDTRSIIMSAWVYHVITLAVLALAMFYVCVCTYVCMYIYIERDIRYTYYIYIYIYIYDSCPPPIDLPPLRGKYTSIHFLAIRCCKSPSNPIYPTCLPGPANRNYFPQVWRLRHSEGHNTPLFPILRARQLRPESQKW